MTTRRLLIGAAAVAVGLTGWYLFRPELLFIDRRADEAPPITVDSGPAAPLLSGEFQSDAHETMGRATVQRLADGGAVLRLSGFSTSNGPDVRVYLVAAPEVTGSVTPRTAGFIDLGALKGNVGDQNYEIPAGTDVKRYRAVSIWCRRFAVNFGSASLR